MSNLLTAHILSSGSNITNSCICLLSTLFFLLLIIACFACSRQKKINRSLREQLQLRNERIAELESVNQTMAQLGKLSYFICSVDTGHSFNGPSAELNPLGIYVSKIHPDHQEQFKDKCGLLLQKKINSFTMNCTVNTQDGIKQYRNTAKLLKLPDSSQYKAVFIIMDMTELAQKNDELANAGKLLKAVFDNVPGFIFLKKITSDFAYERCNPRFSELLQIKPSDIVGKTDFELFERDLANRIRAVDLGLARTHNIADNRWFLTTPDGKEHAIRVISRPLTLEDGSESILGFGIDITLQENIASKMRRRNKELRLLLAQQPGSSMLLNRELEVVCATSSIQKNLNEIDVQSDKPTCSMICQCNITSPDQCAALRAIKRGESTFCHYLPGTEHLYIRPLPDEEGKVKYLAVCVRQSVPAEPASAEAREVKC